MHSGTAHDTRIESILLEARTKLVNHARFPRAGRFTVELVYCSAFPKCRVRFSDTHCSRHRSVCLRCREHLAVWSCALARRQSATSGGCWPAREGRIIGVPPLKLRSVTYYMVQIL